VTHDRQHYTGTMARLLAQQGHWPEAAEIYRHLLRENPGRGDLLQALQEAERRSREAAPVQAAELAPLFEQWVGLMSTAERLRRLRRFGRKR
jgi:hypothetical protein